MLEIWHPRAPKLSAQTWIKPAPNELPVWDLGWGISVLRSFLSQGAQSSKHSVPALCSCAAIKDATGALHIVYTGRQLRGCGFEFCPREMTCGDTDTLVLPRILALV